MSTGRAAQRGRFWWRVLLAGPVVALTSFAMLCGGSLWLPEGAAGIDHLALPLVLFPAIWAGLFFHACLDRRLMRAFAVHAVLLLANAALFLPRLT
jgi:hypothetical protein